MLYNNLDYIKEFRKTEYPIDDLILKRWSPRAFSGENVSREEIMPLFEAAKWAPSANNIQPWRFLFAIKGTENWEIFFNLLSEPNRLWAEKSSVLIAVLSQLAPDNDGRINQTAVFDSGAAWQNMALQGSAMGLALHPMSGFDHAAASKLLKLPNNYSINLMVAVGRPGDKSVLLDAFAEREFPSDRKFLSEIVQEGGFNFLYNNMKLEWQDMYSVNVKEIDEQHKTIFEIINKLFGLNPGDKESLIRIIDEMQEYSKYHFGVEEKYFQEFSYPDKEPHEEMHRAYIAKVQEFKESGADFNEVRDFLIKWWTGHIQGADHQYTNYFNQHGLF